jgi:hypothetical protein
MGKNDDKLEQIKIILHAERNYQIDHCEKKKFHLPMEILVKKTPAVSLTLPL